MLIDLTCPAEIFRTALPTGDIPVVSLTMYNLSDRVIASVEVTVRMLSAAGAEKEKMTFRGRTLNGRPHSTFSMNVPMAPAAGVRKADVIIDKVWFNDNDVWRREEGTAIEYTPNDLPPSNALTNLKFAAGETAVGYPSQQDGLWVCVCGRANPDQFVICARCRREKALVFSQYNQETVENQIALREKQLDLSTRSAREDTARLQRIREEEYNLRKTRRRHQLRLGICLAVCLAVIALLLGGVVPTLRMIQAKQDIDAGNWDTALDTLRDLSVMPGAETRIRECNRQIAAREAAESEDPEILAAAAMLLRADTDEDDFTSLADQADLRRARMLLEAGDTEGARTAAAALAKENEDRKALEDDCLYLEANRALEAKNYSAAQEMFLRLNSRFKDAADLASECVYRPAAEMFQAGDYDSAISLLGQIPDYRDSRQMVQECHYMKAAILEADGDITGAASEYLLAGNLNDATAKWQEMNYILAEAANFSSDLAEAQRLYSAVPGYKDADEKRKECLYTLGRNAYDTQEFTTAYKWLSELPENYSEDANDLLIRSAYLGGRIALAQEDYEKAIPLLSAAGDYRDAAALLGEAMEAVAVMVTPAPAEVPAEPPAPDYNPSDYAIGDDDE